MNLRYTISLLASAILLLLPASCRGNDYIRIDRISGEESIHQIYFRPPLKTDMECLEQGIQRHAKQHGDYSTRFYTFKLTDGTLRAIVIAPKKLGEQYEADISSIAMDCTA